MYRILAFFFVFIFLIFSGCRTPKSLSETSISSLEVQKAIFSHHSKIRSMICEGQISIESPEIAQSGSFTLNLLKPDSILINIRGPFGIKVGSILLTRTEFFFYNSLMNKLITGSSSTENLNRILHFKISFDDLLNLFGGGTFLSEDLHTPNEIKIEEEQFVLIYASEKFTRHYWVDPETLLITKIQFFDQQGKLTIEQIYNDFAETDGLTMPHTIRMIQQKNRQMFALSYSDIKLNKNKLRFSLTIPQNAEKIRW